MALLPVACDYGRVHSQQGQALILWDVDHTLVNTGGLGRRMYEVAFPKVTGRALQVIADMTGRTECAIVTDTLALHGLPADGETLDACYSALAVAAHDLRAVISREGLALPGAAAALTALASAGVMQSVVTGNIRPVAEIKLDALGLASHIDFEIGGYGSDGVDRATLIHFARKRSIEKYGHDLPSSRVFIIGDTPHDIKGARDAGVRSVGVASGRSPVEALREAQAEIVLSDLRDITRLHAMIFGASS